MPLKTNTQHIGQSFFSLSIFPYFRIKKQYDMKKNSALRWMLATIIFVSISTRTTAQGGEEDSKSVHKGTITLDAYYGFPNIILNSLKQELASSNTKTKYTSTNTGPMGIRGEAFIADHVAFGLDVNYSAGSVFWEEETNSNSNIPKIVKNDISFTRLRVLAKCNFHFGATEKFDWYAGGGIGYNSTVFTKHVDGEESYYSPYESIFTYFSAFPLSWRINFGGKYYFTDNIGAGVEIGLSGGPLASACISAKF